MKHKQCGNLMLSEKATMKQIFQEKASFVNLRLSRASEDKI